MARNTRIGAVAGLVAAVSMTATPASAADLPTVGTGGASAVFSEFDTSVYDGDFDVTEWRRWGRRGWRRGWRGRRGIRGGDILAGVLVLGGIAAIASAANNNRRRDRDVVIVERDRDRDYDRRDYDRRDDRRNDRRGTAGSGIDNAVDQCVTRIEQDIRVETVDGVDRTGQGWLVTGVLFNGTNFLCRIDNGGRIADVEYGGFSSSSFDEADTPSRVRGDTPTRVRGDTFAAADGQWTDARYAEARAAMNGQAYQATAFEGETLASAQGSGEPLVPLTSDRMPAYPGGPLPGEEPN